MVNRMVNRKVSGKVNSIKVNAVTLLLSIDDGNIIVDLIKKGSFKLRETFLYAD